MTIQKKIGVFTSVVFFIILLSFLLDIWVSTFSLNNFKKILENNARSCDFVDAIEAESRCFEDYIKNPEEEKKKELEISCRETSQAIELLPMDYYEMSEEHYAKIWSIRNSYETYQVQRDMVLRLGESNPEYIRELYKTYDMQKYLQEYGRILMRYTLEDGTASYGRKVSDLNRIPVLVLVFGLILFAGIISLAHLMRNSIVKPIMCLVDASQRIAANDFFEEDVVVENKDEMGKLVHAFNKMKFATIQYITTLEEKRETLDLLHREEMEKLEVERRLESTKFELLKSQMNPHFLFNTLNVIGGMANLENALTSEKMIKALSALLRYNLKPVEAETVLSQELKILEAYMYLQKMRFGARISYEIDCKVDEDNVYVPPFSFQPLVENAIIHGLARKEEGGRILVRILKKQDNLIIMVTDTGAGMSHERLEEIRDELRDGNKQVIGIGLSNISQRIHKMYRNGNVEVFSRLAAGTAIRLTIPQMKGDG